MACEYCWSTFGHTAGCPNAPEPEPVYTCIECGEGIFMGDKYLDTEDGSICEDCMSQKTLDEILEIFGERMYVVDENDIKDEGPDPDEAYENYREARGARW